MASLSDFVNSSSNILTETAYCSGAPLQMGQLPIYGTGQFRTFYASRSFTAPFDCIIARIRVLGGGGNGGGPQGVGGGGGGEFAYGVFTLIPGTAYAVTVAGQGGTSSFSNLISAYGGAAGNGSAGGAGGTGGTGGTFRAHGGDGGNAHTGSGGGGASGSVMGPGGSGGDGANGLPVGGGGGGWGCDGCDGTSAFGGFPGTPFGQLGGIAWSASYGYNSDFNIIMPALNTANGRWYGDCAGAIDENGWGLIGYGAPGGGAVGTSPYMYDIQGVPSSYGGGGGGGGNGTNYNNGGTAFVGGGGGGGAYASGGRGHIIIEW